MDKMKVLNMPAYEWLLSKPPQQWSRSHFETTSVCDILLNNLCEAFNACIVDTRDKPVITMMESTRRYIRNPMFSCFSMHLKQRSTHHGLCSPLLQVSSIHKGLYTNCTTNAGAYHVEENKFQATNPSSTKITSWQAQKAKEEGT